MRPESSHDTPVRTLALLDGDLPSLVLAGILAERAGAGGPRPLALPIGNGAQRDAAATIAGVLGLGSCAAEAPAFDDGPTGLARGMLALAEVALAARCQRVALPWVASVHGADAPGVPGGDDEAGTMARLALWHDTSLLVSRLLLVHGIELEVELPLVDLDPAQVVDLALDMGLAPELCWWGRAGGASGGGSGGSAGNEDAAACRTMWEPLLASMRSEA
ncbi:MAG: hypothetical protein RBS39_11585 [Phycisphaerales bacterium]|jgi:hypothetical protein|nr:hypothetical protein [Phycisphaerales bacterium]